MVHLRLVRLFVGSVQKVAIESQRSCGSQLALIWCAKGAGDTAHRVGQGWR